MAFFGKKAEHKADPRAAEPEAPSAALPARPKYGIDDTIQLMRTLPLNQNTELILLVIRNTLHSMNVNLKEVIDDGAAKQERLRNDVSTLKNTIADLEAEIAIRKQEVGTLETDLAETTTVRERLEQAAQKDEPIAVPSVAAVSPSKPSARPPKPQPRIPPPPPAPETGDRATMDIDPLPESGPVQGTQRS